MRGTHAAAVRPTGRGCGAAADRRDRVARAPRLPAAAGGGGVGGGAACVFKVPSAVAVTRTRSGSGLSAGSLSSAVTVNVYEVPLESPVTVIGLEAPEAVMLPGFEVTVYDVTAEPPSDVTLPPVVAPLDVIELIAVVVRVGDEVLLEVVKDSMGASFPNWTGPGILDVVKGK